MADISCRQALCSALVELAAEDPSIVVLTSDSRGSASLEDFARRFPDRFIEVGIAEQNLVGIAAGLAASGFRPYVASPASFLSMRSIEQIKVDAAYSGVPVRLVGISGGVSYGALGMSHHSLQDIAVMRAIPGIAVCLPADRHETRRLALALQDEPGPAYIRIGRNPVPDVHESDDFPFAFGRAVRLRGGRSLAILATGEKVRTALAAAALLEADGIDAQVIGFHTVKPLDAEAVLRAADETGALLTLEEHSVHGGFGSAVAEVVVQNRPVRMRILGIPDEPAIAGSSAEVSAHYGLDAAGVRRSALGLLAGAAADTAPQEGRK
ncbi:MAG: transketolase family protein [Clostridia bacterium]|nr:transketolase family protein [Clostridia bacterium]